MVPQMELMARMEATETRMFLTLKALLIIQQLCIHPQPPLLRWLSMDKPCNNLKLPRQNTCFVLPYFVLCPSMQISIQAIILVNLN